MTPSLTHRLKIPKSLGICLILSLALCAIMLQDQDLASAHFFGGETLDVDGRYQVVFLPFPSRPYVGSNETRLNFSVLENNTNIYNIHSALVVTEKASGAVVDQFPYRQYEFSDIIFPYAFREAGQYVVTLQTRIVGDEKYQATPLVASFDVVAEIPGQQMPIAELMLYYVTPAAVAIAAIAIFLNSRRNYDRTVKGQQD